MKKGLLAISPFLFFLAFYLGFSLISGDFSKTPIVVAFFFSAIYAFLVTTKLNLKEKISLFSRGAGNETVIFMILIFISAGAFASSAKAMGCVTETVDLILNLLPSQYILVSLFLAGCFLSLGTGSGMGTIVAIGPIAVGVTQPLGIDMSFVCAIVVCGAMFGDNLSFISDTTIVATSSQGCNLKDKFFVNFSIVLPAAIIVSAIYMYYGMDIDFIPFYDNIEYIKILPYFFVILLSVLGINVLLVLLIGTLLCGIMGMFLGCFDVYGWFDAMLQGIDGMAPFAIVILLASGLIALIHHNGGIEYVVKITTKHVVGRKSAEFCICILTGLVCACTANNTVAIMTVGDIVKNIAEKYGVDKRKAASLLDTSSCIVQELLPYSTHLLVAAAFGGISTLEMIPYVFYAYFLIIFVALSVILGYPKLKRQ